MAGSKKYFIQEHLHRTVFHGGICNIDIEKIFLRNGYGAIAFPAVNSFSLLAKWQRAIYLIKTFFAVAAGDIVIFQFPLYARMHVILVALLRWKGAHIVCLIADIEGLRDGDATLLEKEKKALRRFLFFIVHNSRMKDWVLSLVPNATIAQFEFFDYLTTPVSNSRKKDNRVVFAGNIQKSPFVLDLERIYEKYPQLKFVIYGPHYPEKAGVPKNVEYKGVFEPYELVNHIEGSFGLVWDGMSIERCTGTYGEYLAYNSPHKLSLYIMTGIPLIAPNMSAGAILIKKYGIGCVIESLTELAEVINNIDESAYLAMVQNTRSLALKISQGECLTEALATLEENIFNK